MFGYRIAWFAEDPPQEWPTTTLASLTTHDLPTVAGIIDGQDAADRTAAGLEPDPAGDALLRSRLTSLADRSTLDHDADTPAAGSISLRAHDVLARCGSDLAVATLEDAIGSPHRPNLPGTVDEHPNWRLALGAPIEELDPAGAADIAALMPRRPTAGILSCRMADSSAAPITLPGVVNLRDVGGLTTAGGEVVRTDVLYRSGQLGLVGEESLAAFSELAITLVIDLRSDAEVQMLADSVPTGVDRVHMDVLAGSDSSVVSHLTDLFSDPAGAEAMLRSGEIQAHYAETYRNLVTLDTALRSYRDLFSLLAERSDVTLFHCTAGKDRTGWAAAALLTLLGVPDDDVTTDYLRSSAPVVESFRPVIDQFAASGGDPDLLVPVFRVEEGYLDAARDEMLRSFGSIEGYFRDGLGLGADVQEQLRQKFQS